MDLQAGTEYRQDQLPSEFFNVSPGQVIQSGGKSYKATVNNNGTRSFSPYADTSAYDSLLGSVKGATTDFANTLDAREANAFKDYLGAVKSQPTALETYQQQLEAAGVPKMRETAKGLQDTIYGLEDSLRRVEGNVAATTRNSIVTQAQREGIINEQQKPLLTNLGWLSQNLGRISTAITDATGQALTLTNLSSQDSQRIIDAYSKQLEMITHGDDRALNAFISDTNNFLNVTLAKIQRNEKVSDQEAANAFELLKLQKQAEANMQQAQFTASQPSNSIVTVNGSQRLIDTKTGKTIMELGPEKAASGIGTGGIGTGGIASYYTSSPSNNSLGVNDAVYQYLYGGK